VSDTPMTDEELVSSFEDCTLPNERFHHRDHVRLVWLYLHRYSLLETLARFSEGLQRFASAHGKAGLYHETITWAYIFLIHERLALADARQTWAEFASTNADLLSWQKSLLNALYCEETLRSDRARRHFVFPDKVRLLPETGQ